MPTSLIASIAWLAIAQQVPAASDMSAALREFSAASAEPLPPISQEDIEQLRRGEVLRVYTPPATPDGARGSLGILLTGQSRERTWLALRDPHLSVTEGFVERRLSPERPTETEAWFGLLRLPGPLDARYWRIDVQTETAVVARTKGRAWERSWRLDPGGEASLAKDLAAGRLPGIERDELARGVYVPENRGSWFVIRVGDGQTLIGYRTTSRVGGVIPDALVREYAFYQLEDLLVGKRDRAAQVHEHYRGKHERIFGGDGRPIARFDERPAR